MLIRPLHQPRLLKRAFAQEYAPSNLILQQGSHLGAGPISNIIPRSNDTVGIENFSQFDDAAISTSSAWDVVNDTVVGNTARVLMGLRLKASIPLIPIFSNSAVTGLRALGPTHPTPALRNRFAMNDTSIQWPYPAGFNPYIRWELRLDAERTGADEFLISLFVNEVQAGVTRTLTAAQAAGLTHSVLGAFPVGAPANNGWTIVYHWQVTHDINQIPPESRLFMEEGGTATTTVGQPDDSDPRTAGTGANGTRSRWRDANKDYNWLTAATAVAEGQSTLASDGELSTLANSAANSPVLRVASGMTTAGNVQLRFVDGRNITGTFSVESLPSGTVQIAATGIAESANYEFTLAAGDDGILIRTGAASSSGEWRVFLNDLDISPPSPPVFDAIPDATEDDGTASWTGPVPNLTAGTPPITWTLEAQPGSVVPPGLQVNPTTGQASWALVTYSLANPTYQVRTRATNAEDSFFRDWDFIVNP